MNAIISEQIELVQVLLYLSDRQEKVRQHLNNKLYCDAILAHFQSFKQHNAVILTQRLIDNENFIHIEPLRGILSLEQIAMEQEHNLYNWAICVKEFITETDFHTFYLNQTVYYNWILSNLKQCNFDNWIAFIEQYFRQKPKEFKLIICPLAGNYGFNMHDTSYAVRCMPYYDNKQNPDWKYDFFAKGIAHEYAHCFVNPTVEAHKCLLSNMGAFFGNHKNISDAYNVDYAVMNEYWVRAFAIRFMEQNHHFFSDFDIATEYQRQKATFIYIEKFVELLKDFEQTEVDFEAFYLSVMKSFSFWLIKDRA